VKEHAVKEPRILVAYHTVDGQSAKVAQRVADVLRDAGASVDVREVESAPSPDGYDAVVVGDSIHATHHSRALTRYLRDYAAVLAALPTAMFQVSLTSANPDDSHTDTAHGLVQELLDRTDFDPDVVGMFAGNLAYTRYGWLKRRVMRAVVKREGGDLDTTRDHEYTDWDAVDDFGRDVAALVE
jgi:menaquinone-dependent protoporphyrinogen oxidase